ncbi:MAG: hypothetical protein NUW02_00175 [Candidatus Campbellbacteria bacterium]|nr:hypothetical protein [Candidatus Campbellbacteria bacterium]
MNLLYGNRMKTVSRTRFLVNGLHCRLHHLTNMREVGDRYYAMLGVSRSALEDSDFTFVSFCMHDGEEELLLIIPNSVFLQRFPEGVAFKRFYLPVQCSWVYHTRKKRPAVDWSLYLDAWPLLVPPSFLQSASATG